MQDFVLFGTLLNVLTVTVGSLVGLGIRRLGLGKRLGDRGKRFSDALFYAIGLCVILIGIDGAITTYLIIAPNHRVKFTTASTFIKINCISTQRLICN